MLLVEPCYVCQLMYQNPVKSAVLQRAPELIVALEWEVVCTCLGPLQWAQIYDSARVAPAVVEVIATSLVLSEGAPEYELVSSSRVEELGQGRPLLRHVRVGREDLRKRIGAVRAKSVIVDRPISPDSGEKIGIG